MSTLQTPTYGNTQRFWQRGTMECRGGALGVISGVFFVLFIPISHALVVFTTCEINNQRRNLIPNLCLQKF